jgi:hypothetical protein
MEASVSPAILLSVVALTLGVVALLLAIVGMRR